VLWQLHTGSLDFLVGEDRNLETREVSFFCVDRKTGFVRWEGLTPVDRWWSGIEAVAGGTVLFHGFASPDMPLHRGLTAVDLASGARRWSLAGVRYLRMEGNAVVVVNEGREGEVVGWLDMETGEALEGPARDRPVAGGFPETRLPQPLVTEAIEDPELREAVRSAVPEAARPESVLWVRWDDCCVLSYCEPRPGSAREQSAFRTCLAVLGGVRWSPLFSDVVQSRTRVMPREPFFCQEGMLYFVKEHSTLVAVPLWSV
jgi:hypothetical protein